MRSFIPPGRRGVDAARIIGRSPAEVELELGAGVERPDRKWRHDLPDAPAHFVVIPYAGGRAAGVEAFTLRAHWRELDDASKERVLAWFGMRPRGELGVPALVAAAPAELAIVVGDSFGGTGLAAYEEAYINRLDRRVGAMVAERLGPLARWSSRTSKP